MHKLPTAALRGVAQRAQAAPHRGGAPAQADRPPQERQQGAAGVLGAGAERAGAGAGGQGRGAAAAA